MNIIFDPVRHAYYPEAYPTKLFTSVSKLIEMVKPKFEKDRISKDYAIKHGLSQEEVLEKWALENKVAIDKGKAYHAQQEEILKEAGAKPGQIQDGEISRAIDINNLQPGTYSELIIPYVPQWLIGTADVIQIHDNGEFSIIDFKSNKALTFTGKAFYNKKIGRAVVEKMLPPMSHLDNVNGNHYNLQLSLYSYFLESYGFKLKEGIIRHVIFDEQGNTTDKDYALVYMKKEVENLLKWYKLKK